MKLKPALTYEEQMERLTKKHNLKIPDKKKAKKILQRINYYRLTGYGIGLKKKNNREHYQDHICIEYLFNLYCFDSEFKNNLIRTIEQIEIELRTKIAYHLAIKYGPDVLTNENNFKQVKNKQNQTVYSIIVDNLNQEIQRQKNNPFVKHHMNKYNSKFPIWVSVELITFGRLCSLFTIMKDEDRKAISEQYNTEPFYLKSWILCLVEVRNICAHYNRLYNMPLKNRPRLYSEYAQYLQKQVKIFPILLVIKRMLDSNEQWLSLLNDLKNTFDKYNGSFKYSYMGFPNNWNSILSNSEKSL